MCWQYDRSSKGGGISIATELKATQSGALVATAQVWRLVVIVTLLKPFSNLFLAWGMRELPQTPLLEPLLYLRAMIDPLVIIGIVMQIAWMLMRMSLLSVADLSFVLPVTACGYVISTLLGRLVLHEQVSLGRWIGAILISLGSGLVASSPRVAGTRKTA